MQVPGRVGYQCSNYYRSLIVKVRRGVCRCCGWVHPQLCDNPVLLVPSQGEIVDPNYFIGEDGKLTFRFKTNGGECGNESDPSGTNTLEAAAARRQKAIAAKKKAAEDAVASGGAAAPSGDGAAGEPGIGTTPTTTRASADGAESEVKVRPRKMTVPRVPLTNPAPKRRRRRDSMDSEEYVAVVSCFACHLASDVPGRMHLLSVPSCVERVVMSAAGPQYRVVCVCVCVCVCVSPGRLRHLTGSRRAPSRSRAPACCPVSLMTSRRRK